MRRRSRSTFLLPILILALLASIGGVRYWHDRAIRSTPPASFEAAAAGIVSEDTDTRKAALSYFLVRAHALTYADADTIVGAASTWQRPIDGDDCATVYVLLVYSPRVMEPAITQRLLDTTNPPTQDELAFYARVLRFGPSPLENAVVEYPKGKWSLNRVLLDAIQKSGP
jgi:hypothetical protein